MRVKSKYEYKNLAETFSEVSVEEIIAEFTKCIEYYRTVKNKKQDKKFIEKIANKVKKVLKIRKDTYASSDKMNLVDEISKAENMLIYSLATITKNMLDKEANRNNVTSAVKLKEDINVAMERLNYFVAEDCEYIKLNIHGFSYNYMYEMSENGMIRTKDYNRWIRTYREKAEPLIKENFGHVDFSKPVYFWMYYYAKENFDANNFDKSIIDQVTYSVTNGNGNDTNVSVFRSQIDENRVANYKDGSIWICVKN